MKRLIQYVSAALLLCFLMGSLAGCLSDTPELPADTTDGSTTGAEIPTVDYVADLKLDMTSTTKKQSVTVKSYVDGDTTHFHLTSPIDGSTVLKARYLAVNTPESTGKIEEWGKKASNFTREKLSSAVSIMIESDDEKWNLDSTGGRYLVWVWYKATEDGDYRNLNLEILQNGLAVASNSAQNRYGTTCMAALNQAKLQKLHVHSKEKDPDFPYGEAVELTLKELRINVESYNGMKVAFEGIITRDYGNSVYVEDYDEETDMYYGMVVYYGYNMAGDAIDILKVGNETRFVGTVQYYEAAESYQVSGLKYRAMKPDDPDNIKKLSDGHSPSYRPTDAEAFLSSKVDVFVGEEKKTYDYAALCIGTTVSMQNLKVESVYTTDNEESSSKGAMTLTCTVDGQRVSVRTEVLYDAEGNLVTASYFEGKTIDVRGVVEEYKGSYQIKVFILDDVTVK